MKRQKALAVARIMANEKIKHGGLAHRRGPWDKKKPRKAEGGALTDDEVRERQIEMNRLNASSRPTMANRGARRYAGGGEVDDWVTPPADDWVTPSAPVQQKSSWTDAITDIPAEIGHAASENYDAIKKGFLPNGQGSQGQIEHLMNTGKGIAGIAGLAVSPITGTARSLIGHPMAQLEHKAGELIAPEIAAKDDPQKMYETAKGDVDLAMSAGRPSKGVSIPAAASPAPAASTNEIVAAADRVAQAAGSPVDVPRAFASDNIAVQRAGQMARNVPIVGDSIPRATGQMADQLADATKSIASSYGEGSGPNVASRVGRTVQAEAEAEAQAAAAAARHSDDAVLAAWQRDADVAHQAIAAREAQSLEQARNAVGDLSPQDMGETLIGRLRAGEQEARANKDRLYQVAGDSDAAINSDAISNVRARTVQALEDDGRVIDGILTPASSRMLDELQRFSTLNIENRAVGSRPPVPGGEEPIRRAVSVQGIEQTRKRLNGIAQAATNDADRAAARRIIREFDAWESDAFDNALFSGSPEALETYRRARDANRDWRTRFGYNERDDADRVINRIATGETTPQEVANWLVGASQVGSKGLSSRLLTRLAEATNHDPEALQAIRGGVWNRLSQATEGATGKTAERTASGINEFLNGSGRDVARRLFTPEQQNVMRAYADTLRRGEEGRQLVADVSKTTKPKPMEIGVGPMQELAQSVLGKSGKTDEALFSAIDAYARSGARGDIRTLSDILKVIPEKDKGDLAGAVIRKLGQSKTTGDFSLDMFASEWNKYSPQAKTLLFGNAGPQRQALDDIAKISQRYKDVGRRFGNPSGAAQNVTGLGALASVFTHPYVAIPALVGGAVFAKILAAPASAHRAATWGKAATALARGQTPARLTAFTTASNALASSANKLGANVSGSQIMRMLQGPVPAGAQDEKKQP
jgi:hypothetical protein